MYTVKQLVATLRVNQALFVNASSRTKMSISIAIKIIAVTQETYEGLGIVSVDDPEWVGAVLRPDGGADPPKRSFLCIT